MHGNLYLNEFKACDCDVKDKYVIVNTKQKTEVRRIVDGEHRLEEGQDRKYHSASKSVL